MHSACSLEGFVRGQLDAVSAAARNAILRVTFSKRGEQDDACPKPHVARSLPERSSSRRPPPRPPTTKSHNRSRERKARPSSVRAIRSAPMRTPTFCAAGDRSRRASQFTVLVCRHAYQNARGRLVARSDSAGIARRQNRRRRQYAPNRRRGV